MKTNDDYVRVSDDEKSFDFDDWQNDVYNKRSKNLKKRQFEIIEKFWNFSQKCW